MIAYPPGIFGVGSNQIPLRLKFAPGQNGRKVALVILLPCQAYFIYLGKTAISPGIMRVSLGVIAISSGEISIHFQFISSCINGISADIISISAYRKAVPVLFLCCTFLHFMHFAGSRVAQEVQKAYCP